MSRAAEPAAAPERAGARAPRAPALRAVVRAALRVADVALFYGERCGGIRTYLDAKAAWAQATAGRSSTTSSCPARASADERGAPRAAVAAPGATNGYRLPLGAGALQGDAARAAARRRRCCTTRSGAPLRRRADARTRSARCVVAVHHGSIALDAAGLPGPDASVASGLRAWMRRAYRDGRRRHVGRRPARGLRPRRGARAALRPDPAFVPQPRVRARDHVLYVGRLGREKGVIELLHAAARSREPWRLRLHGQRPDRGRACGASPRTSASASACSWRPFDRRPRRARARVRGRARASSCRARTRRSASSASRPRPAARASWPARPRRRRRTSAGSPRRSSPATSTGCWMRSSRRARRSPTTAPPRRSPRGRPGRPRSRRSSSTCSGSARALPGRATALSDEAAVLAGGRAAADMSQTSGAARRRRAGPARELARGDAPRRRAVRLHLPGAAALPPPVALGLVLSRDRVAHIDPRARAGGAAHGPALRAARTASCRTRRSGTRPPRWRRAPLYATRELRAATLHGVDRPAAAARSRGSSSRASRDDPGFRTEALGRSPRTCDWLEPQRDPDGDGLLTIVAARRVGPRRLAEVRRRSSAGSRTTGPATRGSCSAAGGRAGTRATLIARHDHHVEDVLVNVAYALSLRAMARLSGDARGPSARRASSRRCWSAAWTRDRAVLRPRRPGGAPVRVSTWSALAPLVLPGHARARPRRLVEEHLLDPRRYARAVRHPVGVRWRSRPSSPSWDRFRSLARPVVGQHGVAAGAGAARARLRRRGRPRRPGSLVARRARRLPRVLPPADGRRASARAGSAGRRCSRDLAPPAARRRAEDLEHPAAVEGFAPSRRGPGADLGIEAASAIASSTGTSESCAPCHSWTVVPTPAGSKPHGRLQST